MGVCASTSGSELPHDGVMPSASSPPPQPTMAIATAPSKPIAIASEVADCMPEAKQVSPHVHALYAPVPIDPPNQARSQSHFEDTHSSSFFGVTGNFKPEDVQPFAQPPSNSTTDFVFFLSHRGPDTKEALIRPLSFILKELGVPHFFDQSDDSMQLGNDNSAQMAAAAWSSRVGVVVLSDHFADSKWCLRELNTFLLRRLRAQEAITQSASASEAQAGLLVPVYYVSSLLSQSKLYSHIGNLSSILRKQDEAAHEFLVSLVPRLLSLPAIQSIASIQVAQAQLNADELLIKRLWNKYTNSLMNKTGNKLFSDLLPSSDYKKDMEIIKTVFKTLVPTDIKSGLEVYQPLEYSLVPPVPNATDSAARFSLNSIIVDLLQSKPITLGEDTLDNEAKPAPIRRSSTLTSSPAPIKMLLIQGAAGSGKSLFGWYLCNRYYRPGAMGMQENFSAMPLFVSLPMFRKQIFSDPTQLLSAYFSATYNIKDSNILCNQPLVIILDGLDELGSKINLFKACHLHVWTQTTFLITCRSEFLQDSDVLEYITPTNPISGAAEPSWLGKLYLLPFSPEQRNEYISKFANRYKDVYFWEAQQYVSALENVPQLGAFLHEPLLLFMVLSVLPQFHLGSFVSSNPSSVSPRSSSVLPRSTSSSSRSTSSSSFDKVRRLDPYLLEVQPLNEITWVFPQIRRAELYALFVEGWAEREIARLPVERRPISQHVLDFCSKLAFEMFLHTQTSVTIVDAHAANGSLAASSSRVDRLRAKKVAQSIVSDSWATELFAEHENERACSPLRKSGERYGFLHKSLQEYFTARYMAADLVDHIVFEDSTWNAFLDSSVSELHISRKRVTDDYSVLRFAAELIDQRVRSYLPQSFDLRDSSDSKKSEQSGDISLFQPYGRGLFDILYANRHPVASCNAISILNAAGVGFQARDFSRLDLSSDIFPNASVPYQAGEHKAAPPASNSLVPLADLSGANLSDCKLLNASLRGVRFENSCLDFADVRGADMEQTIFGQSSMFLGHTRPIYCLLLSPDGRLLFSGAEDKTIYQWSVQSGTSIGVFEGHTDFILSLALTTDAEILFSCSRDNTIIQWQVATGSVIRVLRGHTHQVAAVILSRDDKTLFSGSDDRSIRLWSVATGSLLRVLDGHTAFIWCLSLSVDGQTLYSGSGDTTIREWSVETSSPPRVLKGHTDRVNSLALFPDGKTLFSASSDRTIREWSLETGSVFRIFRGHSQDVMTLCFSRDFKSLFSGSVDMTIRQWSVDAASLIRVFEGHTSSVFCVALSPVDSGTLFSASMDKTIRQWCIDVGSLPRVVESHTDYVTALALHASSSRKRLYSGSKDGTIREWCVETGGLVRVFDGHKDVVWSLALSSDGQTLYSGCEDMSVGQWSVDSGSLLKRFQGHSEGVLGVALSADDKIVFSGSKDFSVRSWSASTGILIRVFAGHSSWVFCLAVSSDSQVLFSGSYDKTIRQWTVANGSVVRVFSGHGGAIRALALSSDCKTLYSASDDTTIIQWAVDTGSVRRVLEGHTGLVMTVLLSPDEQKVFSGAYDTHIRVWSTETGKVECVLEGHSGAVLGLAHSRSPNLFFSCSQDRSVREWSQPFSPSVSPSASEYSSLQIWSSGPWSLSARRCRLNDATRLAPRYRLLLTQCGAYSLADAP